MIEVNRKRGRNSWSIGSRSLRCSIELRNPSWYRYRLMAKIVFQVILISLARIIMISWIEVIVVKIALIIGMWLIIISIVSIWIEIGISIGISIKMKIEIIKMILKKKVVKIGMFFWEVWIVCRFTLTRFRVVDRIQDKTI